MMSPTTTTPTTPQANTNEEQLRRRGTSADGTVDESSVSPTAAALPRMNSFLDLLNSTAGSSSLTATPTAANKSSITTHHTGTASNASFVSLDSEILRMSQQADDILDSIRQQVSNDNNVTTSDEYDDDAPRTSRSAASRSPPLTMGSQLSHYNNSKHQPDQPASARRRVAETNDNNEYDDDNNNNNIQLNYSYDPSLDDDDEDDDLSQEMERLEALSAELALSFQQEGIDILDVVSPVSSPFTAAAVVVEPAVAHTAAPTMNVGETAASPVVVVETLEGTTGLKPETKAPLRQRRNQATAKAATVVKETAVSSPRTVLNNNKKKQKQQPNRTDNDVVGGVSTVAAPPPPRGAHAWWWGAVVAVWTIVVLILLHTHYFLLNSNGVIQPPSLRDWWVLLVKR